MWKGVVAVRERDFLDFFNACETESRSKSIGKNFMQSVKFLKYVLGADIDLVTVAGPLLQGRVLRVLSTRDTIHQARALTVDEVRRLEEMLRHESNIVDPYFAGGMLLALFTTARWSNVASSPT